MFHLSLLRLALYRKGQCAEKWGRHAISSFRPITINRWIAISAHTCHPDILRGNLTGNMYIYYTTQPYSVHLCSNHCILWDIFPRYRPRKKWVGAEETLKSSRPTWTRPGNCKSRIARPTFSLIGATSELAWTVHTEYCLWGTWVLWSRATSVMVNWMIYIPCSREKDYLHKLSILRDPCNPTSSPWYRNIIKYLARPPWLERLGLFRSWEISVWCLWPCQASNTR